MVDHSDIGFDLVNMITDHLLVWQLRQGSQKALEKIYLRYRDDLLTLAVNFLGDPATAEDVVQDVFLNLVRSAQRLRLHKSLKGYLLTSVANRVRSIKRSEKRQTVALDETVIAGGESDRPERLAMAKEQLQQIHNAMVQLPYDQREVIFLHLHSGMKFREIAESQNVLLNTVLSRYRYGLEQLRSQLNGKVESWKTQRISKD